MYLKTAENYMFAACDARDMSGVEMHKYRTDYRIIPFMVNYVIKYKSLANVFSFLVKTVINFVILVNSMAIT